MVILNKMGKKKGANKLHDLAKIYVLILHIATPVVLLKYLCVFLEDIKAQTILPADSSQFKVLPFW